MSRDSKRTTPEPLLERALERLGSALQSAAEHEAPSIELDLSEESPLSLADGQRPDPPGGTPGGELEVLARKSSISSILREVRDRYSVGDFTGALTAAERVLADHPGDEAAIRYAERCRETLTQMYAARLGSMDQIPRVTIPSDQITWLSLDHRAGFLLSLIDGASPLESILDISGMSRLDALRILVTLLQQNVIALR